MRRGCKQLVVELLDEEHQSFKKICKKDRTTMSAYVRAIILKILKEEGEKNVSKRG